VRAGCACATIDPSLRAGGHTTRSRLPSNVDNAGMLPRERSPASPSAHV
jgi:hypothetical protein